MAHIADTYSRGWGHITTRQNIQFHFVAARATSPTVLRELAAVGLTTREACGDTVRNVQGCHLAGACPLRGARHHAVGRGRLPALPPPPARPAPAPQVQDQLLRLRHRLRPGHVQRHRRHRREPNATTARSSGLPGVRRRRPRRQPAPGARPRGVHAPRGAARHARGRAPRLLEPRQPRQQAAGPPEVARRHDGLGRAPGPHPQGAQVPAGVVVVARRHPRGRAEGRRRAGRRGAGEADADRARASPVAIRCRERRTSAGSRPTSCGARPRAPSRPTPRPASATSPATQFRALASIQRELGADVRVTNRQNFVFRGLSRVAAADAVRAARRPSAWPSPAPSWPATSSPARAPTPATWPSPRAAASPTPSAPPSRRPVWPRSAASARTSPAARTAAASTTSPTSASSAPSVGPTAAAPPATSCCSAATSARRRSTSARRRCACRRRSAPQAAVRVVGRFADEREAGEAFRSWMERAGGAKAHRRHARGPRRVPRPRRAPRVLRRLRRDRPLRGGHRRLGVRDLTMFLEPAPSATVVSLHRRRARRAQRRVREAAGVEDHPVGRRQLRPAPVAVGVDAGRRAHRPRHEGRPRHRGRVHRHRLPLPRDARHRRGRPAPLRAQPADHDGAALRRGRCGSSTPRTAARR